jgi:tRNA uridine 5-carbamoylmethylation protein Kti12
MKRLVVYRGLPGSGKSTSAKKLQESLIQQGETVAYYEADMYWMTETGEYLFDPNRLSDAHAWCRSKVREALHNCSTVIVANTNLTQKEMDLWQQIARSENAKMEVFHMKTMFGNIHGVPEETLEKMKAKEIDWPGEIVITAIQRDKNA